MRSVSPLASALARVIALVIGLALGGLPGCDRKVEPFVPGEEPSQPDLSRIFPPGAERSTEAMGGAAPPSQPPDRGAPPVDAGSAGPPIRGMVDVAPSLAGELPPGAVLFVIARPGAAGPPLAVKRVPGPTFPLRFEIGPEDRMIQAMPFVGPLQLTARLDLDGNATTRDPGGLQGSAAGAHQPGDENVRIVLDQRL
jgi:hypothetical protein